LNQVQKTYLSTNIGMSTTVSVYDRGFGHTRLQFLSPLRMRTVKKVLKKNKEIRSSPRFPRTSEIESRFLNGMILSWWTVLSFCHAAYFDILRILQNREKADILKWRSTYLN